MEKQEQTLWQMAKRLFGPSFFLKKIIIVTCLMSCFQAFQVIFSIRNSAQIVNAFEQGSTLQWKIQLFAFFAINVVLAFGLRRITKNYNTIFYTEFRKKIFKIVFEDFFGMHPNKIEILGTGKVQSILSQGIDSWVMLVQFFFTNGLRNIAGAIFSFGLIFTLSRSFFVVSLLFLIVIGYFVYRMNKKVQEYRKKAKELYLEGDRQVVKMIQSKMEIVQNHKILVEIGNTDAIADKIKQNAFEQNVYSYAMYDTPLISSNLIRVFVIFVLGTAIFAKTKSIGDFVALMSCFGNISQVIFNLIESHRDVFDRIIHIDRLRNLIDTTPQIGLSKGKEFHYRHGDIHLKDISFSYDKSHVFQNFDLNIKGGTKTAFVGESGGGKTTLIKLLAGYIRPDKGDIEIDGQILAGGRDVLSKHLSLMSYYRHIGYLTQDPSVFDGTIHENLIYALDAEPKKEDVEHVIKLAKCEFVREFEKGLETEIGERGVRLSGGQKQRLAIAKIMLKNPNIILLDEPTSALDSFNEEQISIALHNLFKGKTVIVVAHRLQTVKQADRICYIEQGKIVEEGTHEELVKLGGRYKKMLDLQSGF